MGRLHGGLVLLRRAALDSVDGFDHRYTALADLDLADRLARAGWLCVQVPGVAVPSRGPRPDPVAARRDARRYLAERVGRGMRSRAALRRSSRSSATRPRCG